MLCLQYLAENNNILLLFFNPSIFKVCSVNHKRICYPKTNDYDTKSSIESSAKLAGLHLPAKCIFVRSIERLNSLRCLKFNVT